MSGDLIGEFKGKISGYRVTDILASGPKVEVSFKQSGKLLGVEAFDMATYWSIMTAPDVMYGEGSGVVRSMNGEMACYRATGTAKMTKGQCLSGGACYTSRARHRNGAYLMARLSSTSTRWIPATIPM
ncbi:MAG: hypothetical protein WC294_09155 [Methanoregula sp.]|jgi:hypothetical protein